MAKTFNFLGFTLGWAGLSKIFSWELSATSAEVNYHFHVYIWHVEEQVFEAYLPELSCIVRLLKYVKYSFLTYSHFLYSLKEKS